MVTELTVGTRVPSQLLRKIKQLGSDKVATQLLQSLWLQRFPESIQVLVYTADKIHLVGGLAAADYGRNNSHRFQIGKDGWCYTFEKQD